MSRSFWRVLAGALLILVGILLLLQQLRVLQFTGSLWGGLALLAGGVVFLALWLSEKAEWWPLIPGCILTGWGLATLLGAFGLPSWLTVLLGFGLSAAPFFYLFFHLGSRSNWWALIPGCTLAGWGLGATLAALGLPEGVAPLVGFLGTAAPFIYVFSLDKQKNWWALIPGGMLAMMAVISAAGTALGDAWVAPLIVWGIGLVFCVVYLLDRRNVWALIPSGVLLLVGIGISPLGVSWESLWPLLIILLGVILLVRAFLRRA